MQDSDKPKILIVSKATFFDVDKLGSAVVLGKLLADKFNTITDIHFHANPPRQELMKVVSPRNVNFIENLDADFFTISIDRGNAKVKEVKWEETADKIKLLIFTEKGEVDGTKYATTPGKPHYDKVFTLGIKTPEDLMSIMGEYQSLWEASETFNLDIRNENTRYGQTNIIQPDCKSYAELISVVSDEMELDIKPAEATELLSCIYWKTNSLRNKYTTPLTFTKVANLIEKGANLDQMVTKVFFSLSLIEVKARQEIFNNLVITSDKIGFSKIGKDTAQQLLKTHPVLPEKNPLYQLRDIQASFVIIPISETKTLVLASANGDKIIIKKLFGNFNFVGDNLQSELTFETNASDTETEIKRILDEKVFKRPVTKNTDQPITPTQPKSEKPVETTKATEPSKPDNSQKTNPTPNEVNAVDSKQVEMQNETQANPQPEPVAPASPAQFQEAEIINSGIVDADPLAPSQEEIKPIPTAKPTNIAPADASAPGFGPVSGFGGGFGAPVTADPLPPASDKGN